MTGFQSSISQRLLATARPDECGFRSRISQRWLKAGVIGLICVCGLALSSFVHAPATYGTLSDTNEAEPASLMGLASMDRSRIPPLVKKWPCRNSPSRPALSGSLITWDARSLPLLRGRSGRQCQASTPVFVLATATLEAPFEAPLREDAEMSQLDRLKTMTSVVADTGDFDAIKACSPEDCTTNPSLLLAAAKMEKFQPLFQEAASEAKKNDGALSGEDLVTDVCDRFAVKVGVKLLELLPAHGRVSTEVDADLSFDTEASLAKARKIIALYEAENIKKERILIKMGSTWESIQACRQLEKEGITCNMTLLFSIVQAIACAEAGATLISPFVGRIMDWYKKNTDKKEYTAEEDPGVQSVRSIYRYYKKYGHDTIVMGASFRNKCEILGLAGCDKLTIAPKLLDELAASSEPFEQVLHEAGVECNDPKVTFDEKGFRWAMNEDAMATEKLAEGLRNFAKDGRTLRDHVKQTVLVD